MPVVINDFEVIAEPLPAAPNPPAPDLEAASPQMSRSQLELAIRYRLERAARVRAH